MSGLADHPAEDGADIEVGAPAAGAASLPEPGLQPGKAHAERYAISESAYLWSARVFNLVRRMLGLKLHLHHDVGQLEAGDIFLFNHFARFETFIPQYLLHEHIGAHARAVAAAEFFAADDMLGRYLRSVGAVPNDMPGLLPFLAAEVLRGRKVVVFPEGGMVKDRRVIDEGGDISVYSRTAGERRKHHSGAAVLALVLDAFKTEVRRAWRAGERARLQHWSDGLGLPDGVAGLLRAAERSTRIVPCNITFYPLRVDDNLLRRGVELFARGMSRRATEELLVEGNILLRDTDMDIRLGDPVDAASHWGWWERKAMGRLARRCRDLEDFFHLSRGSRGWSSRVLSSSLRHQVLAVRDAYMTRMYQAVTVNLSHLASVLLLALLEAGRETLPGVEFRRMLYTLVKRVQGEPAVHLHSGLRHPDGYAGLLDESCDGFEQFLGAMQDMGLIEVTDDDRYRLLPALREAHDFDEIRTSNLVSVYANEVAPIAGVARSVPGAMRMGAAAAPALRVAQRLDDALRCHALDRAAFQGARHAEINARETATADAAPYVLQPATEGARLAVVLVHGFLASPAELRGLGEHLCARGHAVVAVRLRGHGTSPWDLHERSMEDWLASVTAGERIAADLAPRHVLVGFSTGGALAVLRAVQPLPGLAGVVAINVPMLFQDPRMRLVSLLHGANSVVGMVTGGGGVMPFQPNRSENPEINYASIPVRGLRELHRLVERLRAEAPAVRLPVRLLQGDEDPVVDPRGATQLLALLRSADAELCTVAADRHGIVYRDVGGSWARIAEFVQACEGQSAPATTPT